jgi:flagellar hook-length control protein FliK
LAEQFMTMSWHAEAAAQVTLHPKSLGQLTVA